MTVLKFDLEIVMWARPALRLEDQFIEQAKLYAAQAGKVAVSLPLVFQILDWYPLRRINSGRELLRLAVEKLP